MTQLLLNRDSLTHIASKLAISPDIVYRQLQKCQFQEDYTSLPEIMSWDEFSYQKGKLAFIAQDFNTKKIITILDNRRQTTIRNHFLKYTKEARNMVKMVTADMSGAYIPLIKKLFPNPNIVLDRFHIVQHLSRALSQTRIQLMKQYDTKDLEYRALKYYWKFILKDSRNLSLKPFFAKTFRETITPRECLSRIFQLVPELKAYYDLYQLLLFHLQEKNAQHFFGFIQDELSHLNKTFKTVLNTFIRYKNDIVNAIELPFILMPNWKRPINLSKTSSAMPLAIGTLITSKNASTSLWTSQKRRRQSSPLVLNYKSPTTVDNEPFFSID